MMTMGLQPMSSTADNLEKRMKEPAMLRQPPLRSATLALLLLALACSRGEAIPLVPTSVTGGIPIPRPSESLGSPSPIFGDDTRHAFVYEVREGSDSWSVDEWSRQMADAASRSDRVLAFYDQTMPRLGWEFLDGTVPSQPLEEGPLGFSAMKTDVRVWTRVANGGATQYVLIWASVVGDPPPRYTYGWGPSNYVFDLSFMLCPPVDTRACLNEGGIFINP
jgi:hypothetical protein